MADIKTNFFGIELASPVITASSGLTNSLDNIKKMADYGVGAVVLKSLFEEEIYHELNQELAMRGELDHSTNEYLDYFDYVIKEENLKGYTKLISDAKKAVNIPVVASINCITSAEWISFTKKIESAGADALELNLFVIPSNMEKTSAQNEQFYFDTVQKVKERINIPVTIKISHYFSNLAKMVTGLSKTGIEGITLFNRFYMPDVDIDKEEIIGAQVLSASNDYALALRWIALMNGKVDCNMAATTGIHDVATMIKFLLAGAHAVQICSALYINGLETIETFNSGLRSWMNEKGYNSISDFQGKLNLPGSENAQAFERVQFMKQYGEY